jgi:hypothetical protein
MERAELRHKEVRNVLPTDCVPQRSPERSSPATESLALIPYQRRIKWSA